MSFPHVFPHKLWGTVHREGMRVNTLMRLKEGIYSYEIGPKWDNMARYGSSEMAGVAGFEPAAYGFGDRCSTSLSYTPAPLAAFRLYDPRPHRVNNAMCQTIA